MTRPTTGTHVFVIIVNWNGKNDTLACLSSLQQIRLFGCKLTVVVVDNGSSDDSVDAIQKKKFSHITVIPTGKNLGFTGGNNIGIEYALKKNADIIWLLNNDTLVHRDVLSFMDVFKDPSVGACGSKIYFAKGREFHTGRYSPSEKGRVLWYAGGKIDWQNMYASHRGVDEVDRGQYDSTQETQFLTGCSFVVRADVARKVGILDNRYYLYLEDLDWSMRIRKAGWKLMYVPSSKIWHVNAGSSGRPGNPLHEYYFTRNRLLVGFKYATLRTKIALIREGIHFVFGSSSIRRRAVIDAFICRFGKQYEPKTVV